MSVYMVTWNLNKESNYTQARKAFIDHLERYQNCKDAGLESVRWISADITADQLSQDLRTKLDDNDSIFVSKLTAGNHQGWLNKATWDWINARL
ncbi:MULTISPECIES: hypothetical protein [Pseudomonas]|uniref:SinR family protein n=1 Tax=Pseudomonas putida TaxID=303 RepID=A0A1Y3KA78_PSEPU|nr:MULTISPECIES: hypothetical protein [Pseudomonas]MBR7522961.1 hypothetical protein [Pseudomonas juntendi]OUM22679.1 hypothetical protein B8W72_30015 [Pseudomonas putida]